MLTSAAARLGLLLVLGVCTQGEEAAPADVQATLDAMHEWSRSIDSPQLLQAMVKLQQSSRYTTRLAVLCSSWSSNCSRSQSLWQLAG
mgnify:CR=1 FL=1